MRVFHGSKELVGLQDKFPPDPVLVINDKSIHPQFSQFNGGGETRRPGADDQDVHVGYRTRTGFHRSIFWREFGDSLDTLNDHSGPQRRHARLDRHSVCNDQTLGALSVGTEETLGAAVFRVMAEDVDVVCKKGRCYGLIFQP